MTTLPLPEAQRLLFWARVNKTRTCWLWTGAKSKGYGKFTIDGRQHQAHRLSFEMAGGTIPDGWAVHHLCEVKRCVRPDHLQVLDAGMHRAAHGSTKEVIRWTRPGPAAFDPDRYKYTPLLMAPLRRIVARDEATGTETLECLHVIDVSGLDSWVKRRRCEDCKMGRRPPRVKESA
jgi:HNH endonuclease